MKRNAIRKILAGTSSVALLAALSASALTPHEARGLALEGFDLIADSLASEPSLARGLELTRAAAEAGDPIALNNMGYLYESGRLENLRDSVGNPLIETSADSAAVYYGRALDRKLTSAAINLLQLAETKPDLTIPREHLAAAHMALGRAYALGNSVLPYNFDASQRHFLEAARLGDEKALEIVRETIGQFPDSYPDLTPADLELIFP